jgi:glycosyltransferase involved in cell wall biosynthesis
MGDLAPTGFGSVTTDLGRELLKLDLDVRFISQNDLGVLPEPFRSRTLSLASLVMVVNTATGHSGADLSVDSIRTLFSDATRSQLSNGEPWGDWRPEAVLVLGDIQAARYQFSIHPDLSSVPAWHYCPVEGRDLPPLLRDDLWALCTPVAMSEFGANEIEKVMGTRPPVVYHGVDTTTFHPIKPSRPVVLAPEGQKPLSLTSRDECKSMWGAYFNSKLPAVNVNGKPTHSDKWMLRTDRHMPRKGYNAMLRALVPVLGMNGDAVLIIHCNATDQGGSLPDTLAKLPGAHKISGEEGKPEGWGLFNRPYTQVVLTNGSGFDRASLVTLYNTADLYLSTSPEGFGLTIAEALACGVPAVGLDYSAVPEVIGAAGKLVPIAYEYDNPYDHLWAAIDEKAFGETVHALLNNPTEREALGRKGPRHVYHSFQWSTAARQFADLFLARAEVAA